MSLVTETSVYEMTVVDDFDHAETVKMFGPQAEERMRSVLTADADPHWQRRSAGFVDHFDLPVEQNRGDVYDAIVDGDDPWTSDDKDRLRRAETVFAFAEALPSLNIDMAEGGQLVQSTGFDQSRTSYRTESSLSSLQTNLKKGAIRLARGILSRHDRDDPEPVYTL